LSRPLKKEFIAKLGVAADEADESKGCSRLYEKPPWEIGTRPLPLAERPMN
jgi:hypothetical protein